MKNVIKNVYFMSVSKLFRITY